MEWRDYFLTTSYFFSKQLNVAVARIPSSNKRNVRLGETHPPLAY